MGIDQVTSQAEKSALLKVLLHKLGDVVHDIQGERGAAGLFLDSLGKIFTRRFDKRTETVDDTFADLRAYCLRRDVIDALPPSYEARLKYLFVKFEGMEDLRDQIRLLSIRYTSALNKYTFDLTVPAIDAMIELAQRAPANNSALVSGYANFLQWKERIGMERALGTRGFYTNAFRNQEFCDRFVSLIAEQKNYLNTFKALASPSQIGLVTEHLDSKDLIAFQDFNKLLEEGAPAGEIERYSGEDWFELCTRIINDLHDTEKRLVEGLEGAGGVPHIVEQTSATASEHTPAVTAMSGMIQKYRKFLGTVPTFSSMEADDLDDLLSHAQVREYQKDKLLFLRDEPAERIYVILQGWVKVYNGLDTGEEAILQMLGSGETLLESSVFLNVPTPVSAQVVEDALLLSIPAPVIRQRLKESPSMALSMLNNVSIRTQRLVQQIELSRLKSAHERVGWFLLRLMLNQKSRGGLIYLPYEKSIIASYLDMRPETFSRALKKFKSEGFEITTDTVQMPEDNALCGFCDIDLASQCARAGSHDCPSPEFSDAMYKIDA